MPSFASLLALSGLLSLPLASAGSHWSHPRHNDVLARSPSAPASYRSARALPRSGRRLNKRGQNEATVKCLTTKTFALCDGDNCTDMGAVAAGTLCVDNAITWDTQHEASAEDSSAASASVEQEEPASSSSAAPAVAVEASTSAAVEISATQKLANNAVVQSSSSSSTAAAAVPTADAGVQLNADSSSNSSDSASDAFDDEEDDEECDSEETDEDDEDEECDPDEVEDESASSSSATTSSKPAQTSAAAPSSTWTPSSSSAVSNVQLQASQAAPKTTTTTTQAPPKTTTTTSSAPAQTSSSGSSSSGGDWIEGQATFFYQYGVAGACGKVHSDSDKVVALAMNLYGSASNAAPDCGRQIEIKNEKTGQSTVATVADACPGCGDSHIDLSVGAFDAIGTQDQGVVPISWKFIS
ncbi:hypothetical protein JCM6882_001935 [Rhodosporidiobolus microsporus]